MAGPALSTSVTAATTGHPAASNAVHAIVNEFDTTISSGTTGQVLASNGSEYIHTSLIGILPAGTTLTVLKAGGTWPARPTSRADLIVQWKGPDPSPSIVSSGTGGMHDNIDIRLITS